MTPLPDVSREDHVVPLQASPDGRQPALAQPGKPDGEVDTAVPPTFSL